MFASDTAAATAGISIVTLLFIVIGIVAYFAPAIIAMARRHHQALSISVLTFLAGWTFFGWIAAMVWACSNPTPAAPPAREMY